MALPLLRSLIMPKTIATVRGPIFNPNYYLSTVIIIRRSSGQSKRSSLSNGGGQKTNGNNGGSEKISSSLNSINGEKSANNNVEGIVLDPNQKKTPEK
ncbi:hypothetical protein TorRG33x02_057270 [Trema orientale]|uniref:Uncharacterized protein n=1 Tax=Trema orientale TaxID=63057 RepID=A0A2P5FL61_TREOI|nr:hypothetical protein TorRG33x02_057270 [Trema orientale]